MKLTTIAVAAVICSAQFMPAMAKEDAKDATKTSGMTAVQAAKKSFGRMEGDRDMNMLQIEPSVINEKYYSSGASERSQYVGNVLPPGAPIPDNGPPGPQKAPAKAEATLKSEATTKTEATGTAEAKTTTEEKKVDATVKTKTGKTTVAKGERRYTGERYYSSGQSERHQFIGNTLPEGAPIPDSE